MPFPNPQERGSPQEDKLSPLSLGLLTWEGRAGGRVGRQQRPPSAAAPGSYCHVFLPKPLSSHATQLVDVRPGRSSSHQISQSHPVPVAPSGHFTFHDELWRLGGGQSMRVFRKSRRHAANLTLALNLETGFMSLRLASRGSLHFVASQHPLVAVCFQMDSGFCVFVCCLASGQLVCIDRLNEQPNYIHFAH